MASRADLLNRYVASSVDTMSPGRAIVALYDRMLLDLDRAAAAVAQGNVEGAHSELLHAQEIVAELHRSLDVSQWPAGAGLAELYRFIISELVAANLAKDAARIRTCRELVVPLRDAWREAAGIVPTRDGAA